MPPEMHYREGEPGAYDAHRNKAQLYLAEMLGIDTEDEEVMMKWVLDNGEKFAEVINENPDLTEKLTKRDLTVEELSYLRDVLQSDKIDTGAEDHDEESFERAA
jgi:hypothetical protein